MHKMELFITVDFTITLTVSVEVVMSGALPATDVPLTGPRSVKVTALTRVTSGSKVDTITPRVALAGLLACLDGISRVQSTVEHVGVRD